MTPCRGLLAPAVLPGTMARYMPNPRQAGTLHERPGILSGRPEARLPVGPKQALGFGNIQGSGIVEPSALKY